MKPSLIILILLAGITGCDDPDIPVPSESLIVVEGWLTDRNEIQQMKLSSTVDFTSGKDPMKITDASVFVSDQQENFIEYVPIPDQPGVYQTIAPFRGIAGRTYVLRIALSNGDTILSAPERMRTVALIDSLKFGTFLRDSEENPQEEILIYYPIAQTSDPEEEDNFYRWRLSRNDTVFSDTESIFIFSDRFIDSRQSYEQEFFTYEYQLEDKATVEIIEISKAGYEFLRQLKAQTASLGTNAAIAPAPIKGNMRYKHSNHTVLGFFGTASSYSRSAIVE